MSSEEKKRVYEQPLQDEIKEFLGEGVQAKVVSEIIEKMREKGFPKSDTLRALKRLLKKREIEKTVVIGPYGSGVGYSNPTDAEILIAIDVKRFREIEQKEVSLGLANEDQKEAYDLFGVKADYLMIHLNRIGRFDVPEPEQRSK